MASISSAGCCTRKEIRNHDRTRRPGNSGAYPARQANRSFQFISGACDEKYCRRECQENVSARVAMGGGGLRGGGAAGGVADAAREIDRDRAAGAIRSGDGER